MQHPFNGTNLSSVCLTASINWNHLVMLLICFLNNWAIIYLLINLNLSLTKDLLVCYCWRNQSDIRKCAWLLHSVLLHRPVDYSSAIFVFSSFGSCGVVCFVLFFVLFQLGVSHLKTTCKHRLSTFGSMPKRFSGETSHIQRPTPSLFFVWEEGWRNADQQLWARIQKRKKCFLQKGRSL